MRANKASRSEEEADGHKPPYLCGHNAFLVLSEQSIDNKDEPCT